MCHKKYPWWKKNDEIQKKKKKVLIDEKIYQTYVNKISSDCLLCWDHKSTCLAEELCQSSLAEGKGWKQTE